MLALFPHTYKHRHVPAASVLDPGVVVPLITRTLRSCGEHLINITVPGVLSILITRGSPHLHANREDHIEECHYMLFVNRSIELLLLAATGLLELKVESRED